MDTFSLEEVKHLVKDNLITSDILKTILESATRRIELYNDEESINILKYLEEVDITPIDIKKEIRKFLEKYESFATLDESSDTYDKGVLTYIVVSLIFIVCGILLYLLER